MQVRLLPFASVAALSLAVAPTMAAPIMPGHEPLSTVASNISPSDSTSKVAPRLPEPAVSFNASPLQYLQAAKKDLAANQTGAAQQALEMAETRLLDRAVAPTRVSVPDQQPVVKTVSSVLHDLGQRNPLEAQVQLDSAIATLSNAPGTT